MGETINPADDEVAAVELAAKIVEGLRAGGQCQLHYDDDQQRRVLQRAGRIARATVKPRRITVRTIDGVFIAVWTDPTPLEKQMLRHAMAEAVNAVQPPDWRERLARRRPGGPPSQ